MWVYMALGYPTIMVSFWGIVHLRFLSIGSKVFIMSLGCKQAGWVVHWHCSVRLRLVHSQPLWVLGLRSMMGLGSNCKVCDFSLTSLWVSMALGALTTMASFCDVVLLSFVSIVSQLSTSYDTKPFLLNLSLSTPELVFML